MKAQFTADVASGKFCSVKGGGDVVVFGIILFTVSAVALIIAAVFFALYRIFEHKPAMLGKVSASLKSIKHKKDKPIYGKRSSHAPLRIVMIIKNWSKGVYEYSVNNKNYTLRYVDLVTPHQMPLSVQVIYLKRFPKIAYAKTDTNFHNFEIYALVALVFSVFSALWGCSVIFR